MPRWIKMATAAALVLAAPADAQQIGGGMPRSASDWLSGTGPAPAPSSAWRPGDTLPAEASNRRATPPRKRPDAKADHNAAAGGGVAITASVPRVGVTRLADGNPDARGVVTAGAAGLPADLWGDATAADLASAIAAAQVRLGATRSLLVRMLTAQLAPPTGSGPADEGTLFNARVDRLISMGMLPEANALLQSAGAGDAARFARRFDLAMYDGDATAVCRQLTERPGLAPDLSARVYCLAQSGDWPAAALILHGARDEGLIPSQTVALLERFLDDTTADSTDTLPDPRTITPLEFRLFEAIGQPLATGELPLAFAWADLTGESGWKAQIEAAERLTRAGAVDPARLAAAYTDQMPAASGGIWDRAASYQRLDHALAAGDDAALSTELAAVSDIFGPAGLLVALARLIAPRLPAAVLDSAAAETAAHLRLLAQVPVPGAARLPADDRALIALAETIPTPAEPLQPAAPVTPNTNASAAAAPAVAIPSEAAATDATPAAPAPAPPRYSEPSFPEGSTGAAYADALRATPLADAPQGGRGPAMLSAMADVEAGLDGDSARAAAGLRRLVELGQPLVARSAAVELLLTEHLGGRRW